MGFYKGNEPGLGDAIPSILLGSKGITKMPELIPAGYGAPSGSAFPAPTNYPNSTATPTDTSAPAPVKKQILQGIDDKTLMVAAGVFLAGYFFLGKK